MKRQLASFIFVKDLSRASKNVLAVFPGAGGTGGTGI